MFLEKHTAKGHFCSLLVSNIIGYLAILQDRHPLFYRSTASNHSKSFHSLISKASLYVGDMDDIRRCLFSILCLRYDRMRCRKEDLCFVTTVWIGYDTAALIFYLSMVRRTRFSFWMPRCKFFDPLFTRSISDRSFFRIWEVLLVHWYHLL